MTQYDVEMYQRIEALIEKKLPAYPAREESVLVMLERVTEAQRLSQLELRESASANKKKRRGDKEESAGASEAGRVLEESRKKRDAIRRAQKSAKRAAHGGGGGGSGR